jgi:hypothetical protein
MGLPEPMKDLDSILSMITTDIDRMIFNWQAKLKIEKNSRIY